LFVYILQSLSFPDRHYVGLSKKFDERLQVHNAGGSPHTSKFKPWKLISYTWFEDESKAHAFERYLKSGSGRSFAKRHF